MKLHELISGMEKADGLSAILESVQTGIQNTSKINQSISNAKMIKSQLAPQDQVALASEKSLMPEDPIKDGIDKILKAKIRE